MHPSEGALAVRLREEALNFSEGRESVRAYGAQAFRPTVGYIFFLRAELVDLGAAWMSRYVRDPDERPG